jgi:predicted metal-dependent hydrolase
MYNLFDYYQLMTTSCTINIEGIGPVLLEKSRRARRVIISVRTSKGTRVAVPMRTSFEKALEFVCLKKEWIHKHLVKIEQDENRSQALIDRFLAIDKAAARRKLTDRLHNLAKEHGFTCNNVTIREQRTRWGSCSSKNNISLNLKLVLLHEELIDYVMLHELVHTRIHNHSKKFWAELDKYTGNGKAMAKRLRMNGLRLL